MRATVDNNGGVRERRTPRPRTVAAVCAIAALATLTGLLAGCDTDSAADPVSTPSATTTARASDVPMPVGDIPGWHQIFADDFPTRVPVGGFSGCDNTTDRVCTGLPSSVAAKWWAYPDGWTDTSGKGTYMPSKVMSIDNGMMHLHLHTADGVHMVAAPVPRLPDPVGSEGGQLYGRYAIRFMVAAPTDSFKLAWLLWPDSENFPRDGEIDYPEGQLNGALTAYMHHQGATSDSDQDEFDTPVPVSSGWHTSVVEWTASTCRFILDGTTIGASTSRIPNTPMHLVLQSETVPDRDTSGTATADIYVAWVAIYQPAK